MIADACLRSCRRWCPPRSSTCRCIASIAGELSDGRLSDRRPFRAPHHSASMAQWSAAVTARAPARFARPSRRPLSRRVAGFSPPSLDSLRQPIESGESVIARANYRVTYPARFQLVAAMNPVPLRHGRRAGHTCARGPRCASDYQGPSPARFSTASTSASTCPPSRAADLLTVAPSEPSAMVRARVEAARAIQAARYEALGLPPRPSTPIARPPSSSAVARPRCRRLEAPARGRRAHAFSPAPTTASSRSPGRWPTLPAPRPSAARTSPKPSATASPPSAPRSRGRARDGMRRGLCPRTPLEDMTSLDPLHLKSVQEKGPSALFLGKQSNESRGSGTPGPERDRGGSPRDVPSAPTPGSRGPPAGRRAGSGGAGRSGR